MAIEVDEGVQTIATREEDTTGIKVAEAAMRAIEVTTKVAIEVTTKVVIEVTTKAIEEDTRAKEAVLKAAEEAMTIPIVEVEVAEGDTNLISTTNQAMTLAITNNLQKEVVTKETTIVEEEDIKTNLALPPILTNKVKIEVATEVAITVAITTLKEAGDINNLKEVVDNSNGNSAKMESSKRPPNLISNDSDTERREFEDNKLTTFCLKTKRSCVTLSLNLLYQKL